MWGWRLEYTTYTVYEWLNHSLISMYLWISSKLLVWAFESNIMNSAACPHEGRSPYHLPSRDHRSIEGEAGADYYSPPRIFTMLDPYYKKKLLPI